MEFYSETYFIVVIPFVQVLLKNYGNIDKGDFCGEYIFQHSLILLRPDLEVWGGVVAIAYSVTTDNCMSTIAYRAQWLIKTIAYRASYKNITAYELLNHYE